MTRRSVEVLVPWRGGCEHRERAWDWIAGHYTWPLKRCELPDNKAPELTEALRDRESNPVRVRTRQPAADTPRVASDSAVPWNKARAVMPAVEDSCADIVVLADADVWTEGLAAAVRAVEQGASWAIPHRHVHRLTEE